MYKLFCNKNTSRNLIKIEGQTLSVHVCLSNTPMGNTIYCVNYKLFGYENSSILAYSKHLGFSQILALTTMKVCVSN